MTKQNNGRNGNGNIWKIIGTLFGSGLLVTMATLVWQASTIASRVDVNCEDIDEFKSGVIPKVSKNHDDIIGIKKDISQILTNMKTMEETEKESTKAIIEAIGRIKNGN